MMRKLGLLILVSLSLSMPALAAGTAPGGSTGADEIIFNPRLALRVSAHFLDVDGWAYAREKADERYYSSSVMDPLSVDDEMGIERMWVYRAGLDGRVSERNHIALNYFYGSAEGRGRIHHPTGFNDQDFPSYGRTEAGLTVEALQLLWYYDVVGHTEQHGKLNLDLGLGWEMLRSYESFTTKKANDLETEAVFAPFVAFGYARLEWWSPVQWMLLGVEAEASFWSWESTALDTLPAAGYFNRADIYAGIAYGKHLDFKVGGSIWSYDVHFDGVETNHLDHHADNEVDLFMMGSFLEAAVKL